MTHHPVPFGEETAEEEPTPREQLCGRIKCEHGGAMTEAHRTLGGCSYAFRQVD
jgi:hypothetical protein